MEKSLLIFVLLIFVSLVLFEGCGFINIEEEKAKAQEIKEQIKANLDSLKNNYQLSFKTRTVIKNYFKKEHTVLWDEILNDSTVEVFEMPNEKLKKSMVSSGHL